MSPYLSEKLRFFSLGGMFLIVLLHSYNASLLPQALLTAEVQNFIVNGICRIAVPIFFMISGFLFWQKFQNSYAIGDYGRQVYHRIFSLVLPYLLWSCGSLALCLFAFRLLRLDPDNFFHVSYDWLLKPRLTYQLWFLKDLFLLTLFSPLIYWAVRRCGLFFIALVCGLTAGDISSFFFQNESLLFFSIGSWLAWHQKLLAPRTCSSWMMIGAGAIWLAACAWNAPPKLVLLLWGRNLFGAALLWLAYDTYKIKRLANYLYPWYAYTFFLYLSHEPLLTILRKTIWGQIPHSALSLNLLFWGLPLLVIAIAFSVASIWQKFHQRSFLIATGNRGKITTVEKVCQ